MIRILLIRHGSTDLMGRVLYGRLPNVHIDDLGRNQCRQLANALPHRYRVEEIVSSPLERALETAEILNSELQVPLLQDEGWIELDYGEWLGMPFEEIRELDSWQHYNRSRSTGVPPGGESIVEVQARAFRALERILERWQHREEITVAVVSHGDVIRCLLVLLLGMSLDHIHRFEVSPGSLSEITLDGRFARVICINQSFPVPEA